LLRKKEKVHVKNDKKTGNFAAQISVLKGRQDSFKSYGGKLMRV